MSWHERAHVDPAHAWLRAQVIAAVSQSSGRSPPSR